MRRFVLVMTLIIVTLGMLGVAFRVHRVEADGTIYIRADGSVDPSTAQIYRDGDVYAFTDNIYDEIVVERSNVVIDGNGNVLEGNGSGRGFSVHGINNVTAKNVVVKDFAIGVYLNSSSGNVISGNSIMANTEHGVYLDGSSNNTIFGNDLENNFKGIELLDSGENTVSGNNITAEAVYNDYGIKLKYCSGNTVSGNNIKNNDEAVYLANSSNNIVSGNNIENNYYSTILTNSSNNIISENNMTNNDEGVRLMFSSSNTVSGNNITVSNNNGVWLFHSSNNTIFGNNIIDCRLDGICLSGSSSNIFSGNTIKCNGENGILMFVFCVDNRFYHNNLVNNTQQVCIQTSGYANFWDNGVEGNYWSDYNGLDLVYDGIGDAPYIIDEYNIDNNPLMGVFSDFNITSECHVQTICSSSISNFQFNGTAISFDVTGENGTAGFCRICIPKALMDKTYVILVNGTMVAHIPLPCSNNTHTYLYFNYTHSTQEVIIIPEFPSLIIMSLLMAIILLTVCVYTISCYAKMTKKRKVRIYG